MTMATQSQSTEITRKEQEGLTERASEMPRLVPPVDVLENQDEIRVVADLPGVSRENLTIRLEESELLLRGEQTDPGEGKAWQPVAFHRTFRVSNTVDPEGVSAELKNGVLTVQLKKREEAKPRQIEVKVH
jgi:HSP20 family molecular chaperone IbpA